MTKQDFFVKCPHLKPSIIAHMSDLNTWEVEADGSKYKVSLSYRASPLVFEIWSDPYLKN